MVIAVMGFPFVSFSCEEYQGMIARVGLSSTKPVDRPVQKRKSATKLIVLIEVYLLTVGFTCRTAAAMCTSRIGAGTGKA